MPELPEVETVRRILHPEVVGATIRGVTFHDFPAVLETTLVGAVPQSLLVDRTILDTSRRGKYLIITLSGDLAIIVHLRMTGRLLLLPTEAPPARFEHLVMHLDNARDLRFADQRKFGRVVVATPTDVDHLNSRLGPEPLSDLLTPEFLVPALARRTGTIKNALLDQHLIAGLGNIYVDESLFLSGIHPLQPSNTLTHEDITRMVTAIRDVLSSALANQGTTFSTFENPYGEAGSNAAFLKVYDRAKKGGTCVTCGTPLVRIVVGGRGTTFCPGCQPLRTTDRPGSPR